MTLAVSEWLETLPAGVVAGEGLWGSSWMIVGEAPGVEEIEQLRPFVGKSGQLLRKTLDEVGVDDQRIWITNVYKSRPLHHLKEMKDHIPYVKYEIQESQPKYILALGQIAFHILTGSVMGINFYRGFWNPLAEEFRREQPETDVSPKNQIDLIQPIVLPTYNPSYILGNYKQIETWKRDINEWYTKEVAA